MFSCNFKELRLVKFILRLFGKRKRRKDSGTPWQTDLDSLAQRYGSNSLTTTTFKVVGTNTGKEESEQLRQLCDQVKDMGVNSGKPDRVVVKKVKRSSDTTAVDLKAWWGQSVATWDPIDGKNLDSIEQVRRPRQSKWFDKI